MKRIGVLAWSVIAFCYLPILVLLINSFNLCRSGRAWEGFTLKWYAELFSNQDIWLAMKNSVLVAIPSTALSTVLGTMSAFAIKFYDNSKFQRLNLLVLKSLLVIPDIQVAIGMLLCFLSIGLNLGLISICIAHTTFCIGYVANVVLAKLNDLDLSIVEAAQDLGAKEREIFSKVIMPMAMPGIVGAALLSFTISIDDFTITFFVRGPGSITLPEEIYGMIKTGSPPLVDTISTLFLLVMLAISALFIMLTHREGH